MWYWHQIWSGTFVIGVAGNIVAAILGFIVGLLVAHRLYDLRKIHKALKHHITTGANRYENVIQKQHDSGGSAVG